MKVIGLTGGIACGKSTASAYLKELGACIVDTDGISRATTKKGGKGYYAVLEHFGRDLLLENGEIDRRKLGGIVFADEKKRQELNALIYPIVIEESKEQMQAARDAGYKVCILDVPLLFESGMETLCDETWLVYVPREEQIRRINERDGLEEKAAAARIDSQMPLEEKMRRADRAIDTSGTIEETQAKLKTLWEESV